MIMDMLQTKEPRASRPAPWRKALLIAVFAGGIIAFFAAGGQQWLDLNALKAHRDDLLNFTERHYWTMLFGTVLVYAGAVALSVPGATVLSLAVGMLFGRWAGAALIVFAATAGATVVFIAARYLFADAVRRRLGARMNALIDGFDQNAFNYLLFLRLVPVFPFWLVNLVPAFTAVPVRTYVAATAIGIIPGAVVFANLGVSLGRVNSSAELLSFEALAALTLLGVFALLPIVVKKLRDRRKSTPPAASPGRDA